MPDYGQDLQFGTFLTPDAAPRRPGRRAGAADRGGRARARDGPGPPLPGAGSSTPGRCSPRSWRVRRRLRVTTNVANLPLRPPFVLAKTVASLDVLSRGRVELGLGAGALLGRDRGRRRTAPYARRGAARARRGDRGDPRRLGHRERRCGSTASTTGSPACTPAGAGARRRDLDRRHRPADARAHRPGRRRLAAQPVLRAAGHPRRAQRPHRRRRARRRPRPGRRSAGSTTSPRPTTRPGPSSSPS